jgi:hypothetical protein
VPTRQAVHAFRGTIPGSHPGQPLVLSPGPPPNPFFPVAGPIASLCNIDLAEFNHTALIVCGPPSGYRLLPTTPPPANPDSEASEIVGVISWGSSSAFSTVEFDWRRGTTLSLAADFITISAYINQLIPNQTDGVYSDLLDVDVIVTVGPSPGHQNRLQRTLAHYNQNPAGPLHFQPYAAGGSFSQAAPAFATAVRPVPSPGTTWKIAVQSFINTGNPITAEYTIASGTVASYPISDVQSQYGYGLVTATCLAGTGFCRLIFDLDI